VATVVHEELTIPGVIVEVVGGIGHRVEAVAADSNIERVLRLGDGTLPELNGDGIDRTTRTNLGRPRQAHRVPSNQVRKLRAGALEANGIDVGDVIADDRESGTGDAETGCGRTECAEQGHNASS
jgi:hypothetical protein